MTSLPPTRRQWFQVYKSQILQEISDYFLKHVRQTAEHVFRVMSQKKWQICGASRLHNLCHSGIAQFSNRSCGDWSDSTAWVPNSNLNRRWKSNWFIRSVGRCLKFQKCIKFSNFLNHPLINKPFLYLSVILWTWFFLQDKSLGSFEKKVAFGRAGFF